MSGLSESGLSESGLISDDDITAAATTSPSPLHRLNKNIPPPQVDVDVNDMNGVADYTTKAFGDAVAVVKEEDECDDDDFNFSSSRSLLSNLSNSAAARNDGDSNITTTIISVNDGNIKSSGTSANSYIVGGVSVVRIDDFISGGVGVGGDGEGGRHSRDDDDELEDDSCSTPSMNGSFYFKYNPHAIALKSYNNDENNPFPETSSPPGVSPTHSDADSSILENGRFDENYAFGGGGGEEEEIGGDNRLLPQPVVLVENNTNDNKAHGNSNSSGGSSSSASSSSTPLYSGFGSRGDGHDSDSSFDIIDEGDLTDEGIALPPRVANRKKGSNTSGGSGDVDAIRSNNIKGDIKNSSSIRSSNLSRISRYGDELEMKGIRVAKGGSSSATAGGGGSRGEDKSPLLIMSPGAVIDEDELVYRSQIVYSSNGQEVSLRTRLGELQFTAGEFAFYQCMFKISDLKNSGRLNNHNSHLPILLLRTGIDSVRMDKILNLVNLKKPVTSGEEPLGLSFSQWLVLCKLICYAQDPKNVASDINEATVATISELCKTSAAPNPNSNPNLNSNINSNPNTIATGTTRSVCNFSLGKPIRLPLAQDHHYKVVVRGFRSYGNGYEQHIKFILVSKVFTVPKSKDAIGSSNSNKSLLLSETAKMYSNTEIEVVRRYSDFELLVDILQKCNPGIILPALPPKSWWSDNVESTAQKRCHLLQLFLTDITHHPLLRLSYELKAFLEASSTGFKSFREMYPKFVDHLGGPMSSSSSNQSYVGYVGSNIVYGASKAYSLVSGLISKVAKTITFDTSLVDVPCQCASGEFEKRLSKSVRAYELAESLGNSLEKFHFLEKDITEEVSTMAFDLKQTSDLMNDTLLDPIVAIFNKFADKYGQVQKSYLEEQSKTVNTNIQYLGTYHGSLVSKSSECSAFKDLLNDSKKRQQSARSQLDLAKTTINTTAEMRTALEAELLQADQDFESIKNQDKIMFDNVSMETRHLESIKSKKLKDNAEEFVRGRIQNCKDNIDVWSELLASLKDSKTWRSDMSGVLDEKHSNDA